MKPIVPGLWFDTEGEEGTVLTVEFELNGQHAG